MGSNESDNPSLMFGPVDDEVFDYFNLDGLFDDAYFPADVDFSGLVAQIDDPDHKVPIVEGEKPHNSFIKPSYDFH